MNKHPMATVDLALSALGNIVVPLLLFGISWWIAKWLLADSDPQWGTPLFWASGITTLFIYQFAFDPPPTRPADVSPNIPPLTKSHLAIRMGLATLYTVAFSLALGITGKPVLGLWLTVALPAAIIVFALYEYHRLYRTYCKEHLQAESSS